MGEREREGRQRKDFLRFYIQPGFGRESAHAPEKENACKHPKSPKRAREMEEGKKKRKAEK
jgi:hypothetical protein